MREGRKRGMRAVEIEAAEKVRAMSQSSLLGTFSICSESLDRCLALKSLMAPGESSVERTSTEIH